WLVSIQKPDGSFVGLDGSSYVFDTAQALKGLFAVGHAFPEAREAARRAAQYLVSQTVDGGRKGFPTRYQGRIPEAIHLYALAPLREAARVFGQASYHEVAELCIDYYCSLKEAFRSDDLTHYLSYALEAAIDLGRQELAAPA